VEACAGPAVAGTRDHHDALWAVVAIVTPVTPVTLVALVTLVGLVTRRIVGVQDVLDKCSSRMDATGASTVLIGRHRQGYALPLTASGVEVGGGDTLYTFRPAAVREEFLLFMSDTLEVTAASQETCTMFGVGRARGLVRRLPSSRSLSLSPPRRTHSCAITAAPVNTAGW
jgi:hypothetical protein